AARFGRTHVFRPARHRHDATRRAPGPVHRSRYRSSEGERRLGMRIFVALAACLIVGSSASAQPMGAAESERTATWYVNHPAALRLVTTACRNDPGHASNNPDCLNADQARVV